MIRDQETLNLLLDNISRFVRERLIPNEEVVAETDEIPASIVSDMKNMGLFGLTIPESYGGLELTMEEEVLAMPPLQLKVEPIGSFWEQAQLRKSTGQYPSQEAMWVSVL